MSDRIKITDLPTLENIAGGDWVPVVDVDDLTDGDQGTTKKVRKSDLKGLNWQGPWSAGAYVTDDAVEHNGSAWVATTNTSEEPSDVATDWDLLAQKGDKGDQGDQGTQGMVWQGAWSAGTYAEDDVVEHNGSAYIALTTTTEEPSLSATDWDLVAQKGDQGDKGNQWQGPWSAGTYQIDDVVEHNGSSWIAIAVTTQEPTNLASEWDLFAKAGEDGEGSGDMLKTNYDPTNVNADAFAMDNMAEGADTKILTAAERAKLANILVTQSVDLDQMELDIAALANGMVYKGNWAANAGTFPGAGAAQTGWFYTVSVAGTVDGVVFNIGDRLIAVVDNASATTYASNWTQLDATDAVTSVASLTGNISAAALLTALALDDVIKDTDTSTAGFGFVVDEDDMASDSPTKVPTQQSVKAYVDSKIPIAPVVRTYLNAGSPHTWTKPAGLKYIVVEVQAGGGSGGAGTDEDGGGGGGGGGGYSKKLIAAASLGGTETATVGGAGGASSFGSHCSATAGSNGVQAGPGGVGGDGGVGSNGDLNIGGGAGASGGGDTAARGPGGAGGSSHLGGGGKGANSVNGGGTPSAGRLYGGGGGGGSDSGGGASGAAGIIIVTEYY